MAKIIYMLSAVFCISLLSIQASVSDTLSDSTIPQDATSLMVSDGNTGLPAESTAETLIKRVQTHKPDIGLYRRTQISFYRVLPFLVVGCILLTLVVVEAMPFTQQCYEIFLKKDGPYACKFLHIPSEQRVIDDCDDKFQEYVLGGNCSKAVKEICIRGMHSFLNYICEDSHDWN